MAGYLPPILRFFGISKQLQPVIEKSGSNVDVEVKEEEQEQQEEVFVGEYVGERLNDGTPDGFGREILGNRDQYEGEYRRGLRNGRGCYWYHKGARYSGEWKWGLKDGFGHFNYPDGSTYCGGWRRNKRHGFGKYTYRNGDTYEGAWKANMRHGVGTYTHRRARTSMRGTWMEDVPKGPVTISYPHCEYHGYFNGTHLVGEGVFTFRNEFMLMGHIELYEASNQSTVDTATESRWCLPRFIAHQLIPYDFAQLPQHPLPLPESDSSSSLTCSESSSESEAADLYRAKSSSELSISDLDRFGFEDGNERPQLEEKMEMRGSDEEEETRSEQSRTLQ